MPIKFESDTIEIPGLEKMLRALKEKQPQARVGILGSKNTTHKAKNSNATNLPTNAEIGAAHEFGAPARGLPVRSFLRMPLNTHLPKALEKEGAIGPEQFQEVLKEGSVIPWMKRIAILAEGVIADAFNTGGFGQWPSWKTPGYSNNAGQILVDTQQLRNSITSEVVGA